MNRQTLSRSSWTQWARRAGHGGTSSLEVIMAFTLLTSVLAFSTPLIVRHQRLVAAQREYRLALDEATNQLDRLSVMPRDELAAAVARLQPSDFLAERLPGAKLHGELQAADIGQRITVSISWGDEQRTAAPVTLAAWFFPESPSTKPAAARRTSP
ncbi:MAG TPA: hypothetical protein VGI40_25045 [Pirellulaceae bacterium]|jgi:hypothetical protein